MRDVPRAVYAAAPERGDVLRCVLRSAAKAIPQAVSEAREVPCEPGGGCMSTQCGMSPEREAAAAQQIRNKGGAKMLNASFLPVVRRNQGPCPRCHLPTYHTEAQSCISALVSRDGVQQRKIADLEHRLGVLPAVVRKQSETIKDLRRRLRYTNIAIKRAISLSDLPEASA
jgi:hypothetical protein